MINNHLQYALVKNVRLIVIGVAALTAIAALLWLGGRKEKGHVDERSQKAKDIALLIDSYRRELEDRPAYVRSVEKKSPPDLEANTWKYVQKLHLEILESLDQYLKDPEDYILDLINGSRPPPYHKVHMIISQEHLPMLQSMLQDRTYIRQWFNIAKIIGSMGAGRQGADILMDYITRYDEFDNRLENSLKTHAIFYMGTTGDDRYRDVLRSALTREGAENLARNWIDRPEYFGGEEHREIRERLLEAISDCAALSLIFMGDEEVKNMLRNLYEQERAKRLSGMTDPAPADLLSRLSITTMPLMDFIETFEVDHVFYLGYPKAMYGIPGGEATIYDMYMRELRKKYEIR